MMLEIFLKKTPTVARLNDVARPSVVASGDLKGGESSSQFQWFTIAKIEV